MGWPWPSEWDACMGLSPGVPQVAVLAPGQMVGHRKGVWENPLLVLLWDVCCPKEEEAEVLTQPLCPQPGSRFRGGSGRRDWDGDAQHRDQARHPPHPGETRGMVSMQGHRPVPVGIVPALGLVSLTQEGPCNPKK